MTKSQVTLARFRQHYFPSRPDELKLASVVLKKQCGGDERCRRRCERTLHRCEKRRRTAERRRIAPEATGSSARVR